MSVQPPVAGTGHNSDPVLAQKIKDGYKAVLEAGKGVVREAIKFGELLNSEKGPRDHGTWLIWLKTNCGLSERTAQRYMWLAQNKSKLETELRKSDLSLNKAIALLSGEKKKRDELSASDKYDKCQETLIKKLQDLTTHQEREAAAGETIKQLKATVAAMKQAAEQAKAA